MAVYSRSDIFIMAVKRQLKERGYFQGDITPAWDIASQKAWQAFCEASDFVFSETPDIGRQEPSKKAEIQLWTDYEEMLQQDEGSTIKTVQPKSLLALVTDHLPNEMYNPLNESMQTEAQQMIQAKSVEIPEELLEQQTEDRNRMEEERQRSIETAIAIAKNANAVATPIANPEPVAVDRKSSNNKPVYNKPSNNKMDKINIRK